MSKSTITPAGSNPAKPTGRPTKPNADRSIKLSITLTPQALALIDAQDRPRSALIEEMIVERWGHLKPS